MKEKHEHVHVLVGASNAFKTHVGFDLMGQNLAAEIMTELEALGEDKPLLYLVGHSLGGLVTRYALGVLYEAGIMDQVTPAIYMSICTPHLGVRAPARKIWRSWINLASIIGQTERQLLFEDNTQDEPLLAFISNPANSAYKALVLFESRICAGIADYDTLVPTPTACICLGTPK